MSPDEVRASIAVVTRIPDEAIRRVVAENDGGDALSEKMIARKADMAKRLA